MAMNEFRHVVNAAMADLKMDGGGELNWLQFDLITDNIMRDMYGKDRFKLRLLV